MSNGPRQRREWLLRAALVVGAPIVVFALLELLFALRGVEPGRLRPDPFVGFAGRSRLFVPERPGAAEASLVTADGKLELFNLQSFPRRKAPGTVRVFCLGGSTTYGRPYDDRTSFAGWLREILPVLDRSQRWEVINAGGISYASYRVARLLEEVVAYEPDVVIVYTGHDEFLEERTYAAVRDRGAPLGGLTESLSATRTWTVMASALRGVGLTGGGTGSDERFLLPEAVAAKLDRSAGLDLYRRAVRADPLSPTPRYQMGLLAINRGALEAAAAHLFLATVLWPEDAKAHEKLGLVVAERGRYRLAVASLEEARRRDPGRRSATDGSTLHGIYTEWAEDGTLRRFADTVDGRIRGADIRWDGAGGDDASGEE